MINDLLIKAESFFNQKKYKEAINELNQIITKDPNNYLAYNLRGSAYLSSGEYKKALDDFKSRISLGEHPVDAEILIFMGECYARLKDRKNAIACFSEYINSQRTKEKIIDPTAYALAHKLRAEIYIEQFKINKAISDLEITLQHNSGDYDAYILLVPLYAQYNEIPKAIQKLTEAINLKLEPVGVLYHRRAECYLIQRRFDEAAADYKEFITLNPNILKPRSDYIEVRLIYIRLLKKLNKAKEASDETQKLLNLKNMTKEEKLIIEQKLLVIPGITWLTDDEDKNLMKNQKNNLEIYLEAKDNFKQGIDNLERGLKFKNNGDNVQAKQFLTTAQKRFEESEKILKTSANSFAESNNLKPLIYRQLAIVHFHLQNYKQAISNFNCVVELDDWCHLQRAICLFKNNLIPEANSDFFKGCELALIRIYRQTNQLLPAVEKEREAKIQKFINELSNSLEKLDEYFTPGSMTHTLLEEAITCYIAANKTKINYSDEQSIAALAKNGLFKIAEQNIKQTLFSTNVLSLQSQKEQEVEPETNLWVMD